MLAHAAYFEALDSSRNETQPEWQSTLAGLVVLRLVDSWLDLGPQVVTTDVTGLRAVRQTIAGVPAGNPLKSILGNLIDALEQAETPVIRALSSHLLAYARGLSFDGQWSLAEDVASTLATQASDQNAQEITLAALMQRAWIRRQLNHLDRAEQDYQEAERLARTLRDHESRIRTALGRAQIERARGNLPKAEEMLVNAFDDAQAHELMHIQALALHDRALVAHARRDCVTAIRLGYNALKYIQDPSSRERLLGDLGAFFADLGHTAAARDAHLILAATACETSVRFTAQINLMEIAAKESQETAFHEYYNALSDAPLLPFAQAHYHLYAGEGYRRFGNLAQAEAELQQSLEIATSHKFNQLIFLAEDALKTLSTQETAQASSRGSWSEEVEQVAQAIGAMRELADAGKH